MNLIRICIDAKTYEDVLCDNVDVRPDGTFEIIGGKRNGEIVEGYMAFTRKYDV